MNTIPVRIYVYQHALRINVIERTSMHAAVAWLRRNGYAEQSHYGSTMDAWQGPDHYVAYITAGWD